MEQIILWDLDGTLINADGAGRRALLGTLTESYGVAGADFEGIPFSGRTDRFIVGRLFEKYGLGEVDGQWGAFDEAYTARLAGELPQGDTRILPGAAELLAAAAAVPGVIQGVVTGNTSGAARAKLEFFGLAGHFSFGAYGEESESRDDLAAAALNRAWETLGLPVPPERCWMVGDTVLDVACGQSIGAHTVAVATGFAPRADLEAAGAESVLDSLDGAAPEEILSAIGLEDFG